MWKCENCEKENRDQLKICWNCTKPRDLSLEVPSGEDFRSNLRKRFAAFKKVLREGPETFEDEGTELGVGTEYCGQCSALLDKDSRFCPSCAAPASIESNIKCLNCDKVVTVSARFCKYCAFDLGTTPHQKTVVVNATASSSHIKKQREKANKLAKSGGFLTVLSAITVFWGHTYTSDFGNTARASFENLLGQADSTYQVAQTCVVFGSIGIVVGVVLFIVGISQR